MPTEGGHTPNCQLYTVNCLPPPPVSRFPDPLTPALLLLTLPVPIRPFLPHLVNGSKTLHIYKAYTKAPSSPCLPYICTPPDAP